MLATRSLSVAAAESILPGNVLVGMVRVDLLPHEMAEAAFRTETIFPLGSFPRSPGASVASIATL